VDAIIAAVGDLAATATVAAVSAILVKDACTKYDHIQQIHMHIIFDTYYDVTRIVVKQPCLLCQFNVFQFKYT
jgi:hypothetical protein